MFVLDYCPDCGIEAISADFAPTKWDPVEQTWTIRNLHVTGTTCLVAAWDDDGEIFRQDD